MPIIQPLLALIWSVDSRIHPGKPKSYFAKGGRPMTCNRMECYDAIHKADLALAQWQGAKADQTALEKVREELSTVLARVQGTDAEPNRQTVEACRELIQTLNRHLSNGRPLTH
jgi:hypothetical protein